MTLPSPRKLAVAINAAVTLAMVVPFVAVAVVILTDNFGMFMFYALLFSGGILLVLAILYIWGKLP